MKILIAEDERITRAKLKRQLQQMGHEVDEAADGQEAWELFQAGSYPIVVCDWEMPRMNGVDLVHRIREAETASYVYIVMLTGKSDKKDVVAGIEAGADDFISKPFDRDELRARLNAGQRIVELEHNLAASNDRLRHELAVARELSSAEHRKHEESLLGDSIPIRALRASIERSAASDDPLLLRGPSGAGQEAVARAIHRSSARRDRPFIYVACPHISAANDSIFGFRNELESHGQPGKALLADGGTLYLEGIETLSHFAQSELIDFLQDAASLRSSGQTPDPDVRVIAYQADRDRNIAVQGSLSSKLRQAIGTLQIAVPSLAERRDDIAVIADHVISRRATSAGKTLEGLCDESKEMLERYSWPGNIRELQTVVERAVMLASGTRVEIPEELLREGRRVGGYTLERKLGQGAMGDVWLARHSLLARPSAVKLIRKEGLQADEEARDLLEQRFQREAKATAQLRSPHTVELYDFGVTEDGDFYYVMEFLRGVDLDSLITKFGPVGPARAVHLLRQACMSLGEAHQAGLVHRDIKPANLFLCQLGPHDDFLKLLDFGIVRTEGGSGQNSTSTGALAGTPASISPEVVRGDDATAASDVYGLGCVAYWLLTGQFVFDAPAVMTLLIKHASEAPRPPSELVEGIPSDFEQLILRCLAKNPEDRPQGAFELRDLLDSLSLEDSWGPEQQRSWWIEHATSLFDVPKPANPAKGHANDTGIDDDGRDGPLTDTIKAV